MGANISEALRTRRVWAAIATIGALLQGCLANSYVIEERELQRLRGVAPAQRGAKVRMVQQFSTAASPPPAPRWQAPPPAAERAADAHIDGDLNSGVWWWWSSPPGSPTFGPVFAPARMNAGPTTTPVQPGGGVGAGSGGSGVGGGVRAAGGAVSSSGSDTGAALAAIAVAGIAIGVGLAVTEGSRYDGWAAMHPSHPVHVMTSAGERRVVPLWRAVDEGLRDDEEAVVVRHEGAGMWLTGRAPLDRQGFSYGFDISRQGVAFSDADTAVLDGTTLEFGYWPTQWAGIQFGMLMGWGNDRQGLGVARLQPRIELDLMPLHVWRLHFGGLAASGSNILWRDAAADSETTLTSSLGPMLQIDLTTRLAMTFRWQWTWDHGRDAPSSQMFGVGLSIY